MTTRKECDVLSTADAVTALLSLSSARTLIRRGPKVSVASIPAELLQVIFLQILFMDDVTPAARTRGARSISSNVFTLLRVCRAWRTLALAYGHLWTRLHMTVDDLMEPLSTRVQFCIKQSGSFPLHVYIHTSAHVVVPSAFPVLTKGRVRVELLCKHWSRCALLCLDAGAQSPQVWNVLFDSSMPTPMPQLVELQLNDPYDYYPHARFVLQAIIAPSLRVMHVPYIPADLSGSSVSAASRLIVPGLRELSISIRGSDDIFELFLALPSLELCTISLLGHHRPNYVSGTAVTAHDRYLQALARGPDFELCRRLRSLHVFASPVYFLHCLLTFAHMNALQDLKVEFEAGKESREQEQWMSDVLHDVAFQVDIAPLPCLTHLTIDGAYPHWMSQFLVDAAPVLAQMTVRRLSRPSLPAILSTLAGRDGVGCVPALCLLLVEDCFVYEEDMQTMIQIRTERDGSPCTHTARGGQGFAIRLIECKFPDEVMLLGEQPSQDF
jgi:hypothetical protein